MQENKKIGTRINIGLKENVITSLEEASGVQLPRAYKEFLFLGGVMANMMAKPTLSYEVFLLEQDMWKERRDMCVESMKKHGINPKSSFWVFDDLYYEQFTLFYLGQGEDPDMYLYSPCYIGNDGKVFAGLEKIDMKFSEYINKLIDYSKE